MMATAERPGSAAILWPILVRAPQRTRDVNRSEILPVELDDGRVLFNLRRQSRENRCLASVSPGRRCVILSPGV